MEIDNKLKRKKLSNYGENIIKNDSEIIKKQKINNYKNNNNNISEWKRNNTFTNNKQQDIYY